MDEESKAIWRRQFKPILHPRLPLLATLIETADKVNAARGFVNTLSQSVDVEREQGMFVATLAIGYGIKILNHFGLGDGDEHPRPIHLEQAKYVLANLVGILEENVKLGQMVVAGLNDDGTEDDAGEDESISDAPRRDAVGDVQPTEAPSKIEHSKPVIDRATFSASCGDKCCALGNTKEFQILERLGKARGTFLEVLTLMQDVWPESDPEKGTVQKTISNLRKNLADAGLSEHFVITSEPNHYRLEIR